MSQAPYGYGTSAQVQYGVDQALSLMKQVPLEGLNEKLIVSVIRRTLESMGVNIPTLLQASAERQDDITQHIVGLQSEIASMNQAIEEKRSQVNQLQDQLREIGLLMERFEESSKR
jgi:hypothetical protein